MSGVFITGTDTGVGKTLICGHLAGYLRRQGVRVITQKWVQTGCEEIPEDLQLHRQLSGIAGDAAPPDLVNPYRFALAASPHLAAAYEGVTIDPEVIARACRQLEKSWELVLVEGTGGFMVPLTKDVLSADVVVQVGLSVLLVVRNGLGCINHALLTVEALRRRQIPLLGLIFSRVEEGGDERVLRDNPRVITAMTGVPLLGELPYLPDPLSRTSAFEPIGEAFLAEWRRQAPHE